MVAVNRTVIVPHIYEGPWKGTYALSDEGADQLHDVEITTTGTTHVLDTAVGSNGVVTIKNATGDTLTVSTTDSQTIDGETSIQLLNNEALTIYSDQSNWHII
jgi:hypothetical protein